MAQDGETLPAKQRLTIGSYTDGEKRAGIVVATFDAESLRLRAVRAAGDVPNPSFLVRRGEVLYVAHELDDCGCLAVYAPTGGKQTSGEPRVGGGREGDAAEHAESVGPLSCRGVCSSPREAGTCFALPHPSGRCLYGANYASGSITCCALAPDGRPAGGLPAVRHEGSGPNRARQNAAHVHSLCFVPGTNLLAAVDLGADAIALYSADAGGALGTPPAATVAAPPGSGPRMLAFHPRLRLAALVGELSCDVTFYRFDGAGLIWEVVGRRGLPRAMARGDALAAQPAFSRDGRRLYVSVRGSERIALFHLDGAGAVVSAEDFSCAGSQPRHIALSPAGTHLAVANQGSDDVTVLALDARTGAPCAAAHLPVRQPSCVAWG